MLDTNTIDIFSSRDKIVLQLVGMAKKYMQLENFEFNEESYLAYIVSMLASLTSNLMYYTTSAYREQFPTKAVQKESLLSWANTLGYKTYLSTPSTCKVLITIPLSRIPTNNSLEIRLVGRNHIAENSEDLTPEVFKVYATGGIPFSLKHTIYIDIIVNNPSDPNDRTIIISKHVLDVIDNQYVNQGYQPILWDIVDDQLRFYADFIQLIDISEQFSIPTLRPYEFHNIKFNFKEEGYISDLSLFVLSTLSGEIEDRWEQKDSLFLLGPNEAGYEFRESDSGIIISFGNGIIGKQPPANSSILITTGLTKGEEGNIIKGSIKSSDPVYYRLLNSVSPKFARKLDISVINTEPSLYGQDPPSIDELRANIIKNVSMNNRLVSYTDYKNVKTIIPTLPINNVHQVLKRSDLKRTEISLFTELIYDDSIVPTKNATIENLVTDEDNYTIPAGYAIDIDDEDYVSIFDVKINTTTDEVDYYYILSEASYPVVITQNNTNYSIGTQILPTMVKFRTERDTDPETLIFDIYTAKPPNDSSGIIYKCDCKIPWASSIDSPSYDVVDNTVTLLDSTSSDSGTALQIFTNGVDAEGDYIQLPLSEIPEGELKFIFTIYSDDETAENGKYIYNVSYVKVIIKKNLNEFMYSQLERTTTHPANSRPHHIDLNADYVIDKTDVIKVMEFYTAGNYYPDETSEYGYSAGYMNVGDMPENSVHHDADNNPQDWSIDFDELMRIIELYNAGSYYPCAGTIDGYAPGSAPIVLGDADDTTSYTTFTIYDVPVVKKDFYDNLYDKELFTKYIFDKLITFDVNSYKMLTDFVSLKFSNTTGYSTNMKYNKQKWDAVYDINPETLPDVEIGTRYAFSNENNPWNISLYSYKKGGYIATKISETDNGLSWRFDKLSINDLITITNLNGDEDAESVVYIYTGEELFLEPKIEIPVPLDLVIFISKNTTMSEQSLLKIIKNKLIDEFAPNFGYNKSLVISKMIKSIQEIPGVANCKVLSPKHDIFFDENLTDNMTQEELLRYTPELIYFDVDNIKIDIKTENV